MSLEHKINLMPTNGLEAKLRTGFFGNLRRSLAARVITYSLAALLSFVAAHGLSGCDDTDYTIKQHHYTLGLDNCEKKTIFYQDADHDGYGNPEVSTQACSQPYGYVTNNQDCDDSNPNVHPGTVEIPYDGIDQDCSGADLTDVDGDEYDSTAVGGTDCDDNNNQINFDAIDIPYDGIDQDCSGVDLADVDHDGFDSTAVGGKDCDDGNDTVHPNATELCDLVDNQCPGDAGHKMVDEECLPIGMIGKIVFVSENWSAGACDIYTMDTDGSNKTNLTNNPSLGWDYTGTSPCGNPALSPDGNKIAFNLVRAPGEYGYSPSEVFIMNLDGSNRRQLSYVLDNYVNAEGGLNPSWSPDGSKIGFSSPYSAWTWGGTYTINVDGSGQTTACDPNKGCNLSWVDPYLAWSLDRSKIAFNQDGEIYIMDADGTNQTNLTNNPAFDVNPSWSPDGSKITFFSDRDGGYDIFIMDNDGSNQTNITNNPSFHLHPHQGERMPSYKPSWSPDGEYIAFMSDRSGNWEIYVMNADGSNQTNITKNTAMIDHSPLWDPHEEERPLKVYYRDADGDWFGNPADSITAYALPAGYTINNTDCDDNDPNIHPGVPEIPYDGIDQDCSGADLTDIDGDGYNSTAVGGTDCNDTNATINPGAAEVCNGVDDNCVGGIDEGVMNAYYRDADKDKYGDSANSIMACTAPAGYAANNTDCNDGNAAVHPGAAEVCNGIDDNCNGQVDEGLVFKDYYRDSDGDGFGDPANSVIVCALPVGYVTNNTDCNDADPNIHPGAVEIPYDGIDQDCSGADLTDVDMDGYDSTAVGGTDCNDGNAAVHPGAVEVCNGIDDNCDGSIDEFCGLNEAYVFVTPDVAGTGNLGGLSGADAICNGDAALNPFLAGRTFKAWLSTSTEDARDRLLHSSVPYKLVDGTLIADDWNDLVTPEDDGSYPPNYLKNPISKDVLGGMPQPYLVWTGTSNIGMNSGYRTCGDWATESGNGELGNTFSRADWTAFAMNDCYNYGLLFCFEQPQEYCGNNLKDGSEACDGTDLGGKQCTDPDIGGTGGTLSCTPDCTGFDTSKCTK